jgi:hypothetical protein
VATPVTVQLVNFETGRCWRSRFEGGDVLTSDAGELKAKTPR